MVIERRRAFDACLLILLLGMMFANSSLVRFFGYYFFPRKFALAK